jgi:integrase
LVAVIPASAAPWVACAPARAAACVAWAVSRLVLRKPGGKPLDAHRFGEEWRRACRAAGVPGVRFHDLRHTFASTLLSRGVSVKAVADWLGHSSATITLSTYAHLMPADEDVARRVLDAALSPIADQSRTDERNEAR